MKISVIVSTYNRPDVLRLVLEALCRQDDKNYEIIVADDGSGESTAKTVREIQIDHASQAVRHVWHEDKGFRLARIRNLAASVAEGDYLIFLDGDCIPPPSFVSRHRQLMEVGYFVCGQRILTTEAFAESIAAGKVKVSDPKFWSVRSFLALARKGLINRMRPMLHLSLGFLRKLSADRWERARGCNFAVWSRDYKRIKGSDESFEGWGAEDSDIAVRLINSGIKIKDGRFGSYVLHMWHPGETRELNQAKLNEVLSRLRNKVIYPVQGMDES